MFYHSAQIYYWLEKCQTEPRSHYVDLRCCLWISSRQLLAPSSFWLSLCLRPNTAFKHTGQPPWHLIEMMGTFFPSIIADAVSLTGARESELSESRHSHMLVWTMRESSIWESLSVASSWLHLLSSLSWLLSSLWISFFPVLLHQLLIAGYWIFAMTWIKHKQIEKKKKVN